ncbi:MAG TPA: hypothetical protein VLK65_28755 [Vicinamibacteria bacterium]|nr:hypothetical protein [Vicinamibacteria bacterium]
MMATVYAVLNRLWGSLSGLATLALVGVVFSPEEQGFYYTFLSLLTFQTLVDLGFGGVVQQLASHEWAKPPSQSRLASLVRIALRWYVASGMVVGVGLGLSGSIYFRRFAPDTSIAWEGIWWLSCVLTGARFVTTPIFSVLEGVNRVDEVYAVRLAQAVSDRIAAIIAILGGGGLAAIPIAQAVSLATGLAGLGRQGIGFVRDHLKTVSARISWRQEVWPLQWRFAVSSAGGYVLFSLFTPVLFASHGAEVAGRMGMTLGVATALTSTAFSFVATRVPRLAVFAARHEYQAMDEEFRRAATRSMVFSTLGAVSFCGAIWTLSPVAERFLPLHESAILLAASVLQQIRLAMGSYLRAHKKEPFTALYVAEGVLALGVLAPLGAHFGSMGMVLAFLAITVVMLLPAIWIFGHCRSQWHATRLAEAV